MKCKVCGKKFFAERSKVLSGTRRCCSKSCRGLAGRMHQPKHHGRPPKHGGCVNGKVSRLYRIWAGIKRRCHCPYFTPYGAYGARGIRMCKEWRQSFAVFMNWAVTHGYNDRLQCDRINNNLGYSPDNCRWVTPAQNCANRRISVILPNGETTAQVAARLGVSQATIRNRLKVLSPEEASTLPKTPNGGLRRWFKRHHQIGKWRDA